MKLEGRQAMESVSIDLMPSEQFLNGFCPEGWNRYYDEWQLLYDSNVGGAPRIELLPVSSTSKIEEYAKRLGVCLGRKHAKRSLARELSLPIGQEVEWFFAGSILSDPINSRRAIISIALSEGSRFARHVYLDETRQLTRAYLVLPT